MDNTFEDISLEQYDEIDATSIYQEGGTFEVPSFQPVVRQFNPVQMRFNAQESDFIKSPGIPQIPDIDYDGLDKLQGKGHTNDVNNYINSKKQAQYELQSLVTKYGYEATKLPIFGEMINRMKVDPAELNELIVRKEMSKEFADINKANGGENEWVTDANGSILVQNSEGNYEYVDPYVLMTSKDKVPITSSDAIQRNDRDNKLTRNQDIMPAVAQVWGGDKALDHLNSQLDKIGSTERQRASEAIAGLGNLNGSNVFGKAGSDRTLSSNEKQVIDLYQSLMRTMDTAAKNYFRNKAIQSIGKVDLDRETYERAVNEATGKLVLSYVSKVLDTKDISKNTVDIDATLTKGIKGGAGWEMPDEAEWLMSTAQGYYMREVDGKLVVDDGWDKSNIYNYDPETGQMMQTDAYFYTDLGQEEKERVQQPIGTSLEGTRVQFNSGIPVTLKGGIQAGANPQLIGFIDKDGRHQLKVKTAGVFKASELEGQTIMVYNKEKRKFESQPIVQDGEITDAAKQLLKAKEVVGAGMFFGNSRDEGIETLVANGFSKEEAEAIVAPTDKWGPSDEGMYVIPFMDDYTTTQAHQRNHGKVANRKQLSLENRIKVSGAQEAQQAENQIREMSIRLGL